MANTVVVTSVSRTGDQVSIVGTVSGDAVTAITSLSDFQGITNQQRLRRACNALNDAWVTANPQTQDLGVTGTLQI